MWVEPLFLRRAARRDETPKREIARSTKDSNMAKVNPTYYATPRQHQTQYAGRDYDLYCLFGGKGHPEYFLDINVKHMIGRMALVLFTFVVMPAIFLAILILTAKG